jgi:hypothetical protein
VKPLQGSRGVVETFIRYRLVSYDPLRRTKRVCRRSLAKYIGVKAS